MRNGIFLLLVIFSGGIAANAVESRKASSELTAQDQGTSDRDIKLTAEIRKAVVGNDDLSTDAHNIKIISRDGQVTLKGPMKSTTEKKRLEQIAVTLAGPGKVLSQIEIAQ